MIEIVDNIKNARGIIIPFKDRSKYIVIKVRLNKNIERIISKRILEIIASEKEDKELLKKVKKIVNETLKTYLII